MKRGRGEESGRRAEAARGLGLLTVPTDVASQGLGSGCPPFNTAHFLAVLTWFDSNSKIRPKKKYGKKYPECCIDVCGSGRRAISSAATTSVKEITAGTTQENKVYEDNYVRVREC
jgi:hypothetical protein